MAHDDDHGTAGSDNPLLPIHWTETIGLEMTDTQRREWQAIIREAWADAAKFGTSTIQFNPSSSSASLVKR